MFKRLKQNSASILFSFLLVIVLILFLVVFFADRSGIGESSVVKIHFADNISPAHEKIIQKFNAEHQGRIEVVPINLPFTRFTTNERKELLARTLRSKSPLIDVFSIDVIWVPRFVRWAHPLTPYFNRAEIDQILPEPLQSCYYQGELVAVPLYTDIGLLYYRKDLLANVPNHEVWEQKLKESITWTEFLQLRKYFPDRPYYLFAADNYEGLICSFYELIKQQNADIFDNGEIQLNTPAARRALKLLVDLVNKYRVTPPEVVNYDEYHCYMDALVRDAVFLRGWPGFLKHYRKEVPDSTKFNLFGLAALPHFQDGKPLSVFGGWNLTISRFSNHKREALEFIKFCLSPEAQKILHQYGGYIPVNKEVYRDEQFIQQNQELVYYRELLSRGVFRPFLENYTKISDIISFYVHKAIKQEISVDEALTRATEDIRSNKFIIQ